MRPLSRAIALIALLLAPWAPAQAAATHGMSLFGDLKYPPDFKHFDYVNPDAQKGGTMREGVTQIGAFDTLNPFVVKGVPAAGVRTLFDTLATSSQDEPASIYGLVAETIDLAADHMSVLYTM